MKSRQKTPALMLVLVMVIALLCSCAGGTQPPASSAAPASSAPAQTASEDKPVLKALVANANIDWNDPEANPVLAYLTEATGYLVAYDPLPADNPADKLNAIISAGTDYDFVVISASISGANVLYAQYASQGALLDLKPLVEELAPNIVDGIDQSLWDICTVNGTYYAVPTANPSGRDDTANIDYGIMVRTDILEKMNAKMPTTLDEFTALLEDYQKTDPMGNGDMNVPLTATIANLKELRLNAIGGAFGVETDWKDVSGELVPYQTQDGFYEYLEYMNDLYSKGLLDTEMPVNQGATTLEKFTTSRALCRLDGYWAVPSLVETFGTVSPDASFEFIQPLEKSGLAGSGTKTKNQIAGYTVIPKNAKNVEATIDYLNMKLDPEIFKVATLGEENVDYTVDEKGAFYPILPTFFEHRGNAGNYATGTNQFNNDYWLCRARKDENQYAAYCRLNYDYGSFIKVDPSTDVPCDVLAKISADISVSNTVTEEFIVNSVVSGITRDSFDAFVTDWKAQCGDKLITVYNEWYQNR